MQLDSRYAELYYLRGLSLYELQRYAEAKVALQRAVDEDIFPRRAPNDVRKANSDAAERRATLTAPLRLAAPTC